METIKQELTANAEETGSLKREDTSDFTLDVVKQEASDVHIENFEEGEIMDVDFTALREFHVLDDIDSTVNEEDSRANRDSDSSSYGDLSDGEINDDELEALLEEGKSSYSSF